MKSLPQSEMWSALSVLWDKGMIDRQILQVQLSIDLRWKTLKMTIALFTASSHASSPLSNSL